MIDIALLIHTTVWLLIISMFVYSRSSSFFHPLTFYLIFHGIVFILRPLLIHYFDYNSIYNHIGFIPTEEQFVLTLMLSTFGLVVFSFFCWYAGNTEPYFPNGPIKRVPPEDFKALIITTIILSPLLAYSAFEALKTVTIDGSDGIRLNIDPDNGIATFVDTTGYLVDAQIMISPIAILFIWYNRFKWWSFLPLGGFVFYRSLIGWGRWAIILTLASFVLIYLYKSRRRWPRLRDISLLIPGYILFWALGVQRDFVRGVFLGETPYSYGQASDDSKWSLIGDSPDFANFDYLSFIISVVPSRSETYTYFTQYLQIFTEPIPRILWPGKPVGPPIQLVNLNEFGNFFFFTNSLVGDGWLSFGWIGVGITMALIGFFLGRIYRWFWRNAGERNVIVIYCLFAPLTLQWYRDGGISIAKFTLFMLFPVLLLNLVRRVLLSRVPAEKARSGFPLRSAEE